jgi:pantothenate kinase-related protein Tda10
MIDFEKYNQVKAMRMKFRALYHGQATATTYRNAFKELLGGLDVLLMQYEDEIAEMEQWYEEQEKKMKREQERIHE